MWLSGTPFYPKIQYLVYISYCFPDCVHMLGLGAWRQHGDPLTTFKTLKHYVFEIIQKAWCFTRHQDPAERIYKYIYIYIY